MPNTPPDLSPNVGARPERRAHRRADLARPVMVETEVSSRPAQGLNVSGGGIALQTELQLGLGEEVGLYFELPIGYAIETRALVVRNDSSAVALRFVDLPKESEVALRSFCRLSGLHEIPKR